MPEPKENAGSTPSRSGGSEKEYLTESEFLKAMAKVVAAFPHYTPNELTWEVYWQGLQFVPAGKLTRALEDLILTSKFFPSVSEILQAAIGKDFFKVKWNGHAPATIREIIREYQGEHRVKLNLLAGNAQKRLRAPEDG